MYSAGSLSFVTLASVATAQFFTPPSDLTRTVGHAGTPVRYKEVPSGICELKDGVKSYSGYADVADNQHYFFWFFEAREIDPEQAPLTIYTDGGPGTSAMIGMFQNIGPCKVNEDGKLENNPYSWNGKSNLLFIDQPTQVGFSYSEPVRAWINLDDYELHVLNDNEDCPDDVENADNEACGIFSRPEAKYTSNSTTAAAPLFWKALQGFFGVFPQYTKNGIHLSSESYGGHYGPVFSAYIQDQNAHLPENATKIDLESLIINNGWFDPLVQFPSYYNFTVDPGNTYDYFMFNKSESSTIKEDLYRSGGCLDQLQDCAESNDDGVCKKADNFCSNHINGPIADVANRNMDDIREPAPGSRIPQTYSDYLNQDHILAAIGAFTNYSDFSDQVADSFTSTGDDSRELGIVSKIQKLLADDIYVVLYNGDADATCDWSGVQTVADEGIKAPGFDSAGFANVSTCDDQVHGVVKQADNFAFLRVYNAGHQVPFYQPLLALEMFERILDGSSIEDGQTKVKGDGAQRGYKTEGDKRSDYREGSCSIEK